MLAAGFKSIEVVDISWDEGVMLTSIRADEAHTQLARPHALAVEHAGDELRHRLGVDRQTRKVDDLDADGAHRRPPGSRRLSARSAE